jgi:hypothetical protein
MKENRGEFTPEIEALGKPFLGKELTLRELRLIPYLDYCAKNRVFDPARISQEERDIISEWKKRGFIYVSSSPSNGGVSIRRDFYDFMNEVLWLGYVDTLKYTVSEKQDGEDGTGGDE